MVVRHSLVGPLVVVVGSLEVVPCPVEERILVEVQILNEEQIQVGLEEQILVGLVEVPFLVVLQTLADLVVVQIQVNLVVEHIIAASL